MAEELSKLSGELFNRFHNDLTKLEALEGRREEIVKKAMLAEEALAKVRIARLNEFFDAYSKGLTDILTKKTSELEDAFLILDGLVKNSTSSAMSAIKKAKKEAAGTSSGGNSNNGNTPPGNDGEASGSGGSGSNKKVKQITSDDTRDKLKEALPEDGVNFADKLAAILKGAEESLIKDDELKSYVDERNKERYKKQGTLIDEIYKAEKELAALRKNDAEEQKNTLTELRLTRQRDATNAEASAQTFINNLTAEIAYANSEQLLVGPNGEAVSEAGAVYSRTVNAQEEEKSARELAKRMADYRAELERKARLKNGKISPEEATKINTLVALKSKRELEALDKLTKERAKKEEAAHKEQVKREREAALQKGEEALKTLTGKGKKVKDRVDAFKELTTDPETEKTSAKAVAAVVANAVSDLAKQLENKIDEIAGYKGAIDTRLQGSNNEKYAGSYWDQLVRDMTGVGAINPYFKQETFANNIKSLVDKGIAFDLKQRAFLMTIQDKIATTFDVADGTLLRLIRIQQEDSTAGRLGMESALNTFLNNMYENTEYLRTVADGVRGSLEEMQSLMQGAEATEVEYQVQKWLGSLYSVGMSQNAVQGISDALGKIAAGQVEGLTGGAGNLLVMAANDAGLSIADILTNGINSSDTNKLLQAAVNYLAELSDSAKDNKVVQQQLADVFGVKASDLRAATNLVLPGTTGSIYENSMSYNNMLSQLSMMAGSMSSRTSMAEMMTNFWENGQYTLAGSMASNPISYFIYKMASVVDDAAGGIDLPFVNVMGFGVDLNTTVSDLMRVAAVGAGILGSIGPMISGLGNSFSGRAMLEKLGIGTGSDLAITPRGIGSSLGGSVGGGSQTTSGSGYAGNSSGSDVKNSTIQEAENSKKQQMVEAKEEEEANQVNVLNTTVLKIYELLDSVAHGSGSFKVKVEGYGLTKAGGSGSGSGALGGVSALNSNSGGNNSSSGTSGSGVNSGGVAGSIDLGGWTMI